jgi:hypothetical protein
MAYKPSKLGIQALNMAYKPSKLGIQALNTCRRLFKAQRWHLVFSIIIIIIIIISLPTPDHSLYMNRRYLATVLYPKRHFVLFMYYRKRTFPSGH